MIFRKENKGIFYFIEYRIGNLVTDEVSDKTVNQVILVTSRVERSQEEI